MPTTKYITLQDPGQFNPGNDITFTIRYSPNYNMQYVTLVIDGYKIVHDGVTYMGGKFTSFANVAEDGEYVVHITVPGGTLGPGDVANNYTYEGYPKAVAVLGTNGTDEPLIDGHVIVSNINLPRSNTVYLNMTSINNSDFTFEYKGADGHYKATGSSLQLWMHLVYHRTKLVSYRIFLYDENMDLVMDSDAKKDWLFPKYPNHSYRLKGLKDNSIYFVSAQAILDGGMVLTIPMTQIDVKYGGIPEPSDKMSLENTITGVKLKVNLSDLQYTRIVITRSAANEGTSLIVKEMISPNSIYTFTDHYTIPKKTYIYSVVVYNGDTIVTTIQGSILYTSNYVVISDVFASYAAIGNVKKYPISRNDRGSEIEVMDVQYPYYIINGEANFERGSVDGIFGELDDCALQLDNAEYAKILREWLNNGYPKLLCYYNGESWIVAVSGVQTSDPDNTDTLSTSFDWVQLGDGEDVDLYKEMGLMT